MNMTGRDLILYILRNGLEDEPVFQNGKFIGFITVGEAAEKLNVGIPTVEALGNLKYLDVAWFSGGVCVSGPSVESYDGGKNV